MTSIPLRQYIGIGLIALLLITDIVSTFYKNMGIIGFSFSILTYLFLAIVASIQLKEVITKSLHHRSCFTIISLVFLSSSLIYYLTNPGSLSGETSVQVRCIQDYLKQSTHAGFHDTCMYGYPARQFYLAGLIHLFADPSLRSLNISGALIVIISLMYLANTLIVSKNFKVADVCTAIAISAFTHFYWFNHFAYVYEQSIFPLAFFLISISTAINYLYGQQNSLIEFTLGGMLLAHSYTPSLAGSGFLIIASCYYALVHQKHRLKILGTILVLIVSSYIASTYRTDITLSGSKDISINKINQLLNQVADLLILPKQHIAWMSPVIAGLIVLPLLFLLAKAKPWVSLPIISWIVISFMAAAILRGYAVYPLDFRLHRALIILPVIIGIVVYYRHLLPQKAYKLLVFLWIFIFVTGFYYQQQQLTSRSPNPHLSIINWIKEQDLPQPLTSLTVIVPSQYVYNLSSLQDNFTYLFPHTKLTMLHPNDHSRNCTDYNSFESKLLIQDIHPCFRDIHNRQTLDSLYDPTSKSHLVLLSSSQLAVKEN